MGTQLIFIFDISSLEPLLRHSQDFDHSAVDSQSWRDPWSKGTIAACSVVSLLYAHVTWCILIMYNFSWTLMNIDWSMYLCLRRRKFWHSFNVSASVSVSHSKCSHFFCIYIRFSIISKFLGFQLFLSFHPAFLSPRCQELRELSMDTWVMGWPVVKLLEIYESRPLSESPFGAPGWKGWAGASKFNPILAKLSPKNVGPQLFIFWSLFTYFRILILNSEWRDFSKRVITLGASIFLLVFAGFTSARPLQPL